MGEWFVDRDGDMNARVGNDTGIWGEVLGRLMMVRKCAKRMGGDLHSSAVYTVVKCTEID